MTYEQYCDLILRTIRANLKPGTLGMTAAAAGQLVRLAAPDLTWKSFSKTSMSQILKELEGQGKIKLTSTPKGALEIQLAAGQGSAAAVAPARTHNPLHKPVWEAFVLSRPVGRRFMHRHSGLIRSGLENSPVPMDEWIEIPTIDASEQSQWAREFALAEGESLKQSLMIWLAANTWQQIGFSKHLQSIDESASRRWNQVRSARVSSVVQAWLDRHSLPPELAFIASASGQAIGHAALPVPHSLEEEDARRTILRLLEALPLRDLLELRIPAGACVRFIKQRP